MDVLTGLAGMPSMPPMAQMPPIPGMPVPGIPGVTPADGTPPADDAGAGAPPTVTDYKRNWED